MSTRNVQTHTHVLSRFNWSKFPWSKLGPINNRLILIRRSDLYLIVMIITTINKGREESIVEFLSLSLAFEDRHRCCKINVRLVDFFLVWEKKKERIEIIYPERNQSLEIDQVRKNDWKKSFSFQYSIEACPCLEIMFKTITSSSRSIVLER